VGIALSFDEHAQNYNPAGLGGIDKLWVTLPIFVEVSNDALNLASSSQSAASPDTSELLKTSLGKRIHVRALAGVAFVVPFPEFVMAFNYGFETQFDFVAQNPVLVELELGFRIDQYQMASFALPIRKGQAIVGITYRGLKRFDFPTTKFTFGSVISQPTDTNTLLGCDPSTNCTTTSGQGVDIGFLYRVQTGNQFRITFGASVINVGGLKFNRPEKETNPADIPQEVNVGFSFQPSLGAVRTLVGIDYRDILYERPESYIGCSSEGPAAITNIKCLNKRLHAGVEFGFVPIDSGASLFSLRLGYNQGYATYGFEFNPFIAYRIMTLQAAYYTQETGDESGTVPEKTYRVSNFFWILTKIPMLMKR